MYARHFFLVSSRYRSRTFWLWNVFWIGSIAILSSAANYAAAQVGDGIQSGVQAYQQADAERQARAAGQVDQNEALRYRPQWGGLYGNLEFYHRGNYGDLPATYYSNYSYQAAPYGPAPNAWGLENPAGFRFAPYSAGYSIVGGTYYQPPMIRQPVGRRELQTGPNRWESFPVYQEDVNPAPTFRPIHTPAVRSGPREF